MSRARRRQLKWWERQLERFAASKAGGWFFVEVAGRADPFPLKLTRGLGGRYAAHEAEGPERARLWEDVNDLYAGYEVYQQRAGDRTIPVIVFARV
jgi:hypothetical protein